VYQLAGVTLTNDELIAASELEFLRSASKIFSEAPARTVQNYLVWRFMMNRAINMPQNIRTIRERFDRVFRGTSAEQPRTILCSNYVNGNMGFAVSKLYIKQYFDENARNQVRWPIPGV
jgi:neprilysin